MINHRPQSSILRSSIVFILLISIGLSTSAGQGDTVQGTLDYHAGFNHWTDEQCQTANPQFNPHLADKNYQSLPIQTVKSLTSLKAGTKVHLQGHFQPVEKERWIFQDDTGSVDVHFRKEFYCNKNSALMHTTLPITDVFATVRYQQQQPYLQLDHYQQDNLFDLGFSYPSKPHPSYVRLAHLEQLAKDGFEPAQWQLANIYHTGKYQYFQGNMQILPIQPQRVVELLHKASRTENNAKNMLMWAYDAGYGGLMKNRSTALALLHQTSPTPIDVNLFYQQQAQAKQLFEQQHYADALTLYLTLNDMVKHSQLRELGDVYFALQDYQNAQHYLQRALVMRQISPNIAQMYIEGLGVDADPEYGFSLLKEIAEYDARASVLLADYYYHGQWVEKNVQQAKYYYQNVINLTENHASSYREEKRLYQHAKKSLNKLRFSFKRH